jgi:hypothetical protein
MMKGPSAVAAAMLLVGAFAGHASADPAEYGLKAVGAATSADLAGTHPDFETFFELKTEKEAGKRLPSTTESAKFELPPGLLANPGAVPRCTAADLIETDIESSASENGCPQDSQVGVTEVRLYGNGGLAGFVEPVFNMEPRSGEPARLGFMAEPFPVLIDTELRSDGDYGVTAGIEGTSSLIPLLSARTTLWGVPADETHDTQRITSYEGFHNGGVPETPTGKRSSSLVPVPFMVNPTRCEVARNITVTATPYALPNLHSKAIAPLAPAFGCSALDFDPDLSVLPTTADAGTGSGLNAVLKFPQGGYEHPNLSVESQMKRAEVTLPEGVTINPSQAQGLGACSEAEFARETSTSNPGEGCPADSKIGTAIAKSPLLEEPAVGSLYVATPHANPFGSLIAVYLVLRISDRGVVVKLPGKVELNSTSGQLVTTFNEIPQLPVSSFELHFREGPRSPLVTPPRCGTYQTVARFTPWADPAEPVTTVSSFEVTHGVNGGACPEGALGFEPEFAARSLNLNAGSFSSFYARLSRHDGEQELTRLSATLPPGLVAKLAGVAKCPDASIEAARSKAGIEELAAPSCPDSSGIGSVLAGSGVGSALIYVPGKLYLAGPYHGAPLSVAAIVPAVAGPFDIGTVITREALDVDPETAEVHIDGSRSDPIPHILAGIPIRVRDVRISVDRPEFTLNPTNCDSLSTSAELWGAGLDFFSSADDSSAAVSSRFQVSNCSRLGFKPRLSLRLSGGTKRGAHPALRAVVRPRTGDANFGSASVALPHSAFLEQAHIRTICTRVQFAAGACPKGSIYGQATAASPLLDVPLMGPVYLRSSNHTLPDLVVSLRGPASLPLEFNIDSRIDSVNGGIRSRFQTIPDVPVSKFVLNMQGGKKGLIVNSRNLCGATEHAKARLIGQNNKVENFNPVLQDDCSKAPRKKQRIRRSSNTRGRK